MTETEHKHSHYHSAEAFLALLADIPEGVENGMDAGDAIAVAQLQATLALVGAVGQQTRAVMIALEGIAE
jgi:hypothetical protein